MNVHERIRRNRRDVMAGVVVAALIALGLTVLRISNLEVRDTGEVLGSIALGVALGLPAVFAWLSLDRRPSLLPAAAMGGIVSGFLSSILLVLWVFPVWMWVRAWNQRPVPSEAPLVWRLARVGLAGLVAVSFLTLFVHIDPVCRQTMADGTTVEVDAADRGLRTGWTLGLGTTSSTGSSGELGGGVVSETCESDRIVIGEALASLGIAAAAAGVATRWPQGTTAGKPAEASV